MTAATLLVMLKKIIIAIMLLQPLVFTSCGGDEPDAPDSGGTVDNGGGSEGKEELDIVITGDTAPKGIQFRRINETDFMLNYVIYSITDGHLSVIGGDNYEIGAVLNGKVSIVSSVTIDGVKYYVREIGKRAFDEFDNIIQIDLPNSISKVGDSAFAECFNLENIKLPDNLTGISNSCFYDCKKLESIKIPDSVKRIDSYAFYGCVNLEYCKLPNKLTIIRDYCFYSCSKFKNIIIPDSVESIGYHAFCGCVNLVTVVCGKSLSNIGEGAFGNCPNLREFYFFSQNMPIFKHNSIGNIDKLPLSSYCLPEYYDNYLERIGSGYLVSQYDLAWGRVYYYFTKAGLKTFDPKTLQL